MRARSWILFLVISLLAPLSPVFADDPVLYEGMLTRFHSSNEGKKTVLIGVEAFGDVELLHLFVFDSPVTPRYVDLLSVEAKPEYIDLYWNKKAKSYVITWLEDEADLKFAFYDPKKNTLSKKTVKLTAQHTATTNPLTSCRTTYNPDKKIYLAAVSDTWMFSFIEIDAVSLEIKKSTSRQFLDRKRPLVTNIAAIAYARGYKQYFVTLCKSDSRTFKFSVFDDTTVGSFSGHSSKSYWHKDRGVLNLHAFQASPSMDDIVITYTEENHDDQMFDLYSNSLDDYAFQQYPKFFEYQYFSDRPFSTPAVDAKKRLLHFIAIDKTDFDIPGVFLFKPSLRLYTVGTSGEQYNGPKGVAVKITPAKAEFAGGAIVKGALVLVYALGGKTYYSKAEFAY